jgi:hypothetical protein
MCLMRKVLQPSERPILTENLTPAKMERIDYAE